LQAELKGIQVLSEEEERDLQTILKEKQDRETALDGKVNEMRKATSWLEGMFALEKELGKIDEQQQSFETRRYAFEPAAKKLEKTRRALGCEGDYRRTCDLRTQQEEETKELNGVIVALPEKEKAAADAVAAKQAAETLLIEARTRQVSEADIIKKYANLMRD